MHLSANRDDNSGELVRIRLDLENLSITASESTKSQTRRQDDVSSQLIEFRESLESSLGQQHAGIERRLGTLESLHRAQQHVVRGKHIDEIYSVRRPPASNYSARRSDVSSKQYVRSRTNAIGLRVKQYSFACRADCSCSCHNVRRSSSPKSVNLLLGQLFASYAGLPVLSDPCDMETCEKKQTPSISVEYWFPAGFAWSRIVRLQLAYDTSVGPSLQLSALRRVSDTAQCVTLTLKGDIDGLKRLFSEGLASPRDVSTTRGYSLLRVR